MTVRELYDAAASRYDAIVEATRYIGPAWLERTLPPLPAPERCVDLACATGTLGRVLRRHFPETQLIGIDVSPLMIEQARRSQAYDELFVHDLDLPFPQVASSSAQLVVALGFMEFLADPAALLAETARVLAAGGTLLVSFQQFWPDRPALAPRSTRSGSVPHHAYSIGEVEALLQAQAFSVQTLESTTGYVSGTGFACPYVMASAVRTAPARHRSGE